MIKFYFPKDTEALSPLFTPQELQKSLFMIAADDQGDLALTRFIYGQNAATVYTIYILDKRVDMGVLDGLFRAMMFHLMELGVTQVTVAQYPQEMASYFKALGFRKEGDAMTHDDFPSALFMGCPSCGGRG